MALYFPRIFTLILIIKLVAPSSAVRVAPEGSILSNREIRLMRGVRQENDGIIHQQIVCIPARENWIIDHEEVFRTGSNQIIHQVIVGDGPMQAPGVRVRLISNGMGYQNVTLRFISARNRNIDQIVLLYGH